MSLDAITLVIEPPRDPLPDVAGPDAVRSFYEYDRFAAALATHTRTPVTVIEALLREAPARGALLVHTTGYEMFDQCDPAVRKQTAARTLVLNGGRATLIQKLDQYRFAGGITTERYTAWLGNPANAEAAGLYGLRTIAEQLGAECSQGGPYPSERYCLMGSDRFVDLPALIVAYLEALPAGTN
jgi:hypothetical protein